MSGATPRPAGQFFRAIHVFAHLNYIIHRLICQYFSYRFAAKHKKAPEGVPSIKQVLPAEKTIGVRAFVRTPFHTPCLARYSVLHLLGVLSGGNEPPLCKGRWLAKQDGGFVKAKISSKTIPQPPSASAPFTKGAFGLCALKVCLFFLTSTAFVDTKAKPRASRSWVIMSSKL